MPTVLFEWALSSLHRLQCFCLEAVGGAVPAAGSTDKVRSFPNRFLLPLWCYLHVVLGSATTVIGRQINNKPPPKTTHYIYLYYWVNWVSACFYIKRQRYVLRYLSSRALKTLSVALVKYVCITWRHFQSSCGSSFPYYSLLQCQTLCSALSFSVLCSRLSARRGKQTVMTVGFFFFFYRNLFDDKSQKRNEFVIVIKQKCSSLTKTPPLPRLQNCPFSQIPSSLHSAQCFLWDCTLTGPVWVLDPVWHYLGNQQVFPWET